MGLSLQRVYKRKWLILKDLVNKVCMLVKEDITDYKGIPSNRCVAYFSWSTHYRVMDRQTDNREAVLMCQPAYTAGTMMKYIFCVKKPRTYKMNSRSLYQTILNWLSEVTKCQHLVVRNNKVLCDLGQWRLWHCREACQCLLLKQVYSKYTYW